jgi:hypothetical protein
MTSWESISLSGKIMLCGLVFNFSNFECAIFSCPTSQLESQAAPVDFVELRLPNRMYTKYTQPQSNVKKPDFILF